MKSIAIIGAGGWGTALSIALSHNVETIRLWVFEPELYQSLCEKRTNELYLPGFFIPANVSPTLGLDTAIAGAELVLTAVPSQHLRSVCRELLPHVQPEQVFLSATKGIESQTLLRMSEVIADVFRPRFAPRLAALSGPTFAWEVAHGAPTAVVVASQDGDLAAALQKQFSTPAFRLYTNTDVIGVELGGAVKNVIAIAAGVCEGMGLGSNAIAAVITRGLSEMTRLACACGARSETLVGLAGLGDLVLTCTGAMSRNRSAGVELGRGRSLQEILGSTRMAIEGIYTTAATVSLARRQGIEVPITEQMHALLFQNRSPQEALRELMERSLKRE
ncbi:MAG: NAD(P)-dependent glycerol-3-phosphate dehydrogenase [Acidobacteria bacterium]|nr:NAD(P)-dependent glycerol-3-phosphate dehydrogenase [Acidobacteriota bacterium]